MAACFAAALSPCYGIDVTRVCMLHVELPCWRPCLTVPITARLCGQTRNGHGAFLPAPKQRPWCVATGATAAAQRGALAVIRCSVVPHPLACAHLVPHARTARLPQQCRKEARRSNKERGKIRARAAKFGATDATFTEWRDEQQDVIAAVAASAVAAGASAATAAAQVANAGGDSAGVDVSGLTLGYAGEPRKADKA